VAPTEEEIVMSSSTLFRWDIGKREGSSRTTSKGRRKERPYEGLGIYSAVTKRSGARSFISFVWLSHKLLLMVNLLWEKSTVERFALPSSIIQLLGPRLWPALALAVAATEQAVPMDVQGLV